MSLGFMDIRDLPDLTLCARCGTMFASHIDVLSSWGANVVGAPLYYRVSSNFLMNL